MIRNGVLLTAALASLAAANAMAFNQGKISGADLGAASSFAETSQVTITVALNLNNRAELEQLVQSVFTRGNPAYHRWFFNASKAYDQTTGVGVPDVANLLEALKNLD